MAKKNQEPEVIEGAAVYMEEFFSSGKHKLQKQLKLNQEMMKTALMDRLSVDQTFREFGDLGVVAMYRTKKTYKTDRVALNEFLYNLGILQLVAKFNHQDMKKEDPSLLELLKDFQMSREFYVQMFPNKNGKYQLEADENYEEIGDDNILAVKWLRNKNQLNEIEQYEKNLKQTMLACPILDKKRKLSCHYGSVSKIETVPKYDTARIYKEFGEEFVIHHAKVDMEACDKFIHKGMLTPGDLNQFRKAVSMSSEFVVMDAESYGKIRMMTSERTVNKALNFYQSRNEMKEAAQEYHSEFVKNEVWEQTELAL